MLRRGERQGIKGWAFPQYLSMDWGAKANPRAVFPCLLHSNRRGYWLGSRGRHATVAEHARAQGLCPDRVWWREDKVAFALLGDSMAACCISRITRAILFALGAPGLGPGGAGSGH